MILDDFAARREAMRLGLNVKVILAVIKKMVADDKVKIDDLKQFYQQLLQIKFRVKRSIFDAVFVD